MQIFDTDPVWLEYAPHATPAPDVLPGQLVAYRPSTGGTPVEALVIRVDAEGRADLIRPAVGRPTDYERLLAAPYNPELPGAWKPIESQTTPFVLAGREATIGAEVTLIEDLGDRTTRRLRPTRARILRSSGWGDRVDLARVEEDGSLPDGFAPAGAFFPGQSGVNRSPSWPAETTVRDVCHGTRAGQWQWPDEIEQLPDDQPRSSLPRTAFEADRRGAPWILTILCEDGGDRLVRAADGSPIGRHSTIARLAPEQVDGLLQSLGLAYRRQNAAAGEAGQPQRKKTARSPQTIKD